MDYQAIIDEAINQNNMELATQALQAAAQADAAAASAKGMAQAAALLSMMGSAIGEGLLIFGAFGALGRNPKLDEGFINKILIGAALVETTAIYAFLGFLIITFS